MANFDFDVVVKIGSMALIRKKDNDLDYNIFARLARELKPGYILVSSGATEIGRIDYMQRNGGVELKGDLNSIKASYAAQGQPILMELYRRFVKPRYSVRQMLIEHSHFNNPQKVEHIKELLFSAANQNAIPIINYNDAVSDTENMKLELMDLKEQSDEVVECIDNDETAAVITRLVNAKLLVILSSIDGIYMDINDPSTIIETVTGKTYEEVEMQIDEMMKSCEGASRIGANGAAAKLKYAKEALKGGTTVIIANAKNSLQDIIAGKVKRTYLRVGK
ncbi:MAG: uridylate kinase [Christensenellaceae bacterium]|jgi:glutamate 5-kinase